MCPVGVVCEWVWVWVWVCVGVQCKRFSDVGESPCTELQVEKMKKIK